MGSAGEIFRPAFAQQKDIEGNSLYQYVSYGLTYDASCAKHVRETYSSKRAYIVASTSLSKQTSCVRNLEEALGSSHLATWVGIRPHTPWEDLVPIINDMREKQADCLITIGGGSLIDGAKIIILVRNSESGFISSCLTRSLGSRERRPQTARSGSFDREEIS
jgi:alcohol dehydrogenase class IV